MSYIRIFLMTCTHTGRARFTCLFNLRALCARCSCHYVLSTHTHTYTQQFNHTLIYVYCRSQLRKTDGSSTYLKVRPRLSLISITNSSFSESLEESGISGGGE